MLSAPTKIISSIGSLVGKAAEFLPPRQSAITKNKIDGTLRCLLLIILPKRQVSKNKQTMNL